MKGMTAYDDPVMMEGSGETTVRRRKKSAKAAKVKGPMADYGYDSSEEVPTDPADRMRLAREAAAWNETSPWVRQAKGWFGTATTIAAWLLVLALGAAVLGAGAFVFTLLNAWGAFERHHGMPDIVQQLAPPPPENLQIVANLSHAPGNVAVSPSGRIFFTFHPDAPQPPCGTKLAEWRVAESRWVPFPDAETQSRLVTPLGLRVDKHDRLWLLDHAFFGLRKRAALFAFTLAYGADALLYEYEFDRHDAPYGSMLNDLQVDAEGRYIYIADESALAHNPGFVVYDSLYKLSWRALESDVSVFMEKRLTIRVNEEPVRVFGLALKVNLDSIALDSKGEFMYYGAMSSGTLWRIPTVYLRNHSMSDIQREEYVELVSAKPLSDGILIDDDNNVYVTAMEQSALVRIDDVAARAEMDRQEKRSTRGLTLMAQSDRLLRWPDGLSFGPDGDIYMTASALHLFKMHGTSVKTNRALGPYHILRVRT